MGSFFIALLLIIAPPPAYKSIETHLPVSAQEKMNAVNCADYEPG